MGPPSRAEGRGRNAEGASAERHTVARARQRRGRFNGRKFGHPWNQTVDICPGHFCPCPDMRCPFTPFLEFLLNCWISVRTIVHCPLSAVPVPCPGLRVHPPADCPLSVVRVPCPITSPLPDYPLSLLAHSLTFRVHPPASCPVSAVRCPCPDGYTFSDALAPLPAAANRRSGTELVRTAASVRSCGLRVTRPRPSSAP